MKARTIIISVCIILVAASCATEYDKLLKGHDVPAKYAKAFELYESGKYSKAAEMFESLSIATKGTAQDDTVEFYWAMSNYMFKDYVTAQSNFSEFISVFPLSPFTEQARFLYIDCLYKSTYRYELDQVPTYNALTEIYRYMTLYPNSKYLDDCIRMRDDLEERLDKKAFEAAHLYYHMEDYLAAHYALKNVLKEDAENRYREEILYFIAMSAYKYADNSVPEKRHERYLSFVDDYYNFVSEYPESKHRRELDNIYARVNRIVKRID
ncbi:MAG: outer membrane protein assembly factor BamD [Bacteroidales bacterium]|nr:outer membrane protein assembly factor BamD [Bacteroidales bacterium]